MPKAPSVAAKSGSVLYLWPDAALYAGRDVAPHMHRHSAAQCAVALGGALVVRAEDGFETATEGAVLVDANVTHAIASPGNDVAFLYLERSFFPQWPAAEYAGRSIHGISFLEAPVGAALRAQLADAQCGQLDSAGACAARTGLLSLFAPAAPRRPPVDPRVRKVLDHLASHTGGNPRGDDLAALAGLSSGRLQHLFLQHAGMPIRRYLLWCRIRRVIVALHDGANLTGAAHEAGFSDSAHFSRTFRAMTGIAPSDIFSGKPRASIVLCDG